MNNAENAIRRSELKPIWCRGCGNHAVLEALIDALNEKQASACETVVVSGIGCSSRLPGYLNCFGLNSIHGRVLPMAAGIKLHNPSLTVLGVSGDGDAMGIGLNHFAHAARKDIDLTYLVFDNRVYGLTKGQTSPTTPLDTITVTHPYGNLDPPINIIHCALSFGATFIARVSALDRKQMTWAISRAMGHKGFSVIHILTPCITFRASADFDFIRNNCRELDRHDALSTLDAFQLADSTNPCLLGIFYEAEGRNYERKIKESAEMAEELGPADMKNMLDMFVPG